MNKIMLVIILSFSFINIFALRKPLTPEEMERKAINQQLISISEKFASRGGTSSSGYRNAVKTLLISINSEMSLKMLEEMKSSGQL